MCARDDQLRGVLRRDRGRALHRPKRRLRAVSPDNDCPIAHCASTSSSTTTTRPYRPGHPREAHWVYLGARGRPRRRESVGKPLLTRTHASLRISSCVKHRSTAVRYAVDQVTLTIT